LDLDHI